MEDFELGGAKNLMNSLVLESRGEEEEKSDRREKELGFRL